MSQNCKNCATPLEGKFCSNCGQSADTHKLNLHYMLHDIQHGLLHFDKGIFFTTKELFTRPGHTIREFLEGKRVKHFKPLSMVIVVASIYAFLVHFFHIDLDTDISVRNGNNGQHVEAVKAFSISEWMLSHYSLTRLISIPFLALGAWICFLKQRYNFAEYLVISAFITAQVLVFRIILLPANYFFGDSVWLMLVSNAIQFILFIWTYAQFFNNLGRWRVFFQSVAAMILYLLFLGTVVTIIVLGTAFFAFS